MKNICSLQRGKVYSKKYISENSGMYPVYSSQTANDGVLGNINTYDYDGSFLTWTTDGAHAGTIFYRKGKFSITNVCGLIIVSQDKLDLRFLYYWLSLTAKSYVNQGMGNPKLMSNQVENIDIPMLPLDEQKHIASTLDRLETLTSDLLCSLPSEIKARRQQYEYYREKLLTFKRKAA
jgi:type I restriction enzyme S subunit